MHRAILAAILLLSGTFHAFSQAMLRPGDLVEIRLGGVPTEYIQEFSSQYTVDDVGAVNLPYVGPVTVSNLSLSEATRAIENKLKADEIYTNPSITINVTPQTRFVNVGGAVRQPGRIPYTPDLTLMSAINAAGGFNEFASPKSIRLIRGGKSETFDARKLRRDPSLDPKISPGDQIEVPQSWL